MFYFRILNISNTYDDIRNFGTFLGWGRNMGSCSFRTQLSKHCDRFVLTSQLLFHLKFNVDKQNFLHKKHILVSLVTLTWYITYLILFYFYAGITLLPHWNLQLNWKVNTNEALENRDRNASKKHVHLKHGCNPHSLFLFFIRAQSVCKTGTWK